MRLSLALAGFIATTVVCQAGLIVNGSFETPASEAEILSFGAGPTLSGWTVSGGVETVRNNFQNSSFLAYDGVRYLDLDGVQAGAIGQSITTTPGALYTLTFAYSNNPYPLATHPASAQVFVCGNSTLVLQSISHNTATTSSPDWIVTSFNFVADSSTTTIGFGSLDPGNSIGGIYLDAIDVTGGVPEPGTTALIAGGLSALIFLRRRN